MSGKIEIQPTGQRGNVAFEAYYRDFDLEDMIGYGATPEEAEENLKELYD